MSKFFTPAPIADQLIEENGLANLSWILFFNSIFTGDPGQSWTPTFIGLTETGGAATITGKTFQISQSLVYFSVKIVPATNTSAVAGTTYISNFPFRANGDGVCFAVVSNTGLNVGMVDQATNVIYVPGWSTVTVPISIIGIVEAS